MSLDELRSQVLTLDYRDRAALVHDLLDSLEALSPDQLEAVWAEEADRRLEELRGGGAEEIPGPEVLRQARALLG
jgi:putative addiction module component (TIGR02574 family)